MAKSTYWRMGTFLLWTKFFIITDNGDDRWNEVSHVCYYINLKVVHSLLNEHSHTAYVAGSVWESKHGIKSEVIHVFLSCYWATCKSVNCQCSGHRVILCHAASTPSECIFVQWMWYLGWGWLKHLCNRKQSIEKVSHTGWHFLTQSGSCNQSYALSIIKQVRYTYCWLLLVSTCCFSYNCYCLHCILSAILNHRNWFPPLAEWHEYFYVHPLLTCHKTPIKQSWMFHTDWELFFDEMVLLEYVL